MSFLDVVEFALSRPIDWGQFEKLVCEIVAQDDFPRLRKLGGIDDEGQDAIDEAFFLSEGPAGELRTVVQITSDKAQLTKFTRTVDRLKEAKVDPQLLVMVYRQPVASSVRRDIGTRAHTLGIVVDIRDESYLQRHLGNPANGIFARYFGDVRSQVDQLLDQADPLAVAPDRVYRAMLASLGAFVLHPHARLARQTLFEQTVLASIVASKGLPTIDDLQKPLQELLPEETIGPERIRAAATALEKGGHCTFKSGVVAITPASASTIGTALSRATSTYDGLRAHVIARVKELGPLDAASAGYIERNLRRAMVTILRSHGPSFSPADSGANDVLTDRSIVALLSANLTPAVGRRALLGLHEYLVNEGNRAAVARLARTYAALAIRNMDPLGRRWQQATLSRSQIALDTDLLLYVLVEELPESAALRECLAAFAKQGTKLVIPESVLAEAVGHVQRAPKTMRRFQGRLHRMSPDMVDGHVWHAVVRGYYYALKRATTPLSWETFFRKYYDAEHPRRYIEHVLRRRLDHTPGETSAIPNDWHVDIEEITRAVLESKERTRPKSVYREAEDMERRVREDVRIAMSMAVYTESRTGTSARGYVASDDGAFRRFESHPAWGRRPKVHVFTKALPEIAEFVCGKIIDDDTLVRVLFHPVTAAAAEAVAGPIDECTKAGIDLSDASVDRLEWDLRQDFQTLAHADNQGEEDEDDRGILRTIRLAEAASIKGYSLDPEMRRVVGRFDEIQEALAQERRLRAEEVEAAAAAKAQRQEEAAAADARMRDTVKRVATAAIGQTKKGRSRVRRALERLGLSLDSLLSEGVGGAPTDEVKKDTPTEPTDK